MIAQLPDTALLMESVNAIMAPTGIIAKIRLTRSIKTSVAIIATLLKANVSLRIYQEVIDIGNVIACPDTMESSVNYSIALTLAITMAHAWI